MATLDIQAPTGSQNITGSIVINAPLAKVFNAYIDQDLFKKWWSRGNNLEVSSFNAETGGRWHVSEKSDQGTYEFIGSFHEVALNERIIWTFEFLGLPERGHVALEKMDFKSINDKATEIITTSTYQSIGDRDGMIASGMEEGWRQSLEALELAANG